MICAHCQTELDAGAVRLTTGMLGREDGRADEEYFRLNADQKTVHTPEKCLRAQLDKARDKRTGDANTIHQLRLNADDWHDERAELRAALGLDQPWTVAHTLLRLADAAEHLLDAHDCDAHGWEEVRGCVERARSYAKLLEVVCSKGVST